MEIIAIYFKDCPILIEEIDGNKIKKNRIDDGLELINCGESLNDLITEIKKKYENE